MKCLNRSQIIYYQDNLLDHLLREKIEKHLKTCKRCQEKVDWFEKFEIFFRNSYHPADNPLSDECLDDDQLTSLLEEKISSRTRETFYSHLSKCDACVEKLISTEQFLLDLKQEGLLVHSPEKETKFVDFITHVSNLLLERISYFFAIFRPIRPAYGWAGMIILLLISGIALMGILPSSDISPIITREIPSVESVSSIQLLDPIGNIKEAKPYLEFKWLGPAQAVEYNFVLLDSDGKILWEKRTENSEILIPANIKLQNDSVYFWQVEAFFRDGSSVTSRMEHFSISQK